MPMRWGETLPGPEGVGMDAEERALLACRAASERKARDIIVLDLREISSITDLFLICSGQNLRQMQAIAEAIDDHLSGQGVEPLSREGTREGSWILLDYDDLVVHIFSEDAREFYSLERLWARARRLTRLAGAPLPTPPVGTTLEAAASRTGSAQ